MTVFSDKKRKQNRNISISPWALSGKAGRERARATRERGSTFLCFFIASFDFCTRRIGEDQMRCEDRCWMTLSSVSVSSFSSICLALALARNLPSRPLRCARWLVENSSHAPFYRRRLAEHLGGFATDQCNAPFLSSLSFSQFAVRLLLSDISAVAGATYMCNCYYIHIASTTDHLLFRFASSPIRTHSTLSSSRLSPARPAGRAAIAPPNGPSSSCVFFSKISCVLRFPNDPASAQFCGRRGAGQDAPATAATATTAVGPVGERELSRFACRFSLRRRSGDAGDRLRFHMLRFWFCSPFRTHGLFGLHSISRFSCRGIKSIDDDGGGGGGGGDDAPTILLRARRPPFTSQKSDC